MRHFIFIILISCIFNNSNAQTSEETFKNINSKLSTKYFYKNLDFIQERFDSEKYDGVILRAKNLLLTHHNFDPVGLKSLYTLLIISFCRLEYNNQIDLYKEKAIKNGVNVDSIVANCQSNAKLNINGNVEKKNPTALDFGGGYKFGYDKDARLYLPNYTLNLNFRKYFYVSLKAKLFINMGFSYYSAQHPQRFNLIRYKVVNGKLLTYNFNFASLKVGLGFDVLLFKKANISMAPSVFFSYGSYLHDFNIEFREQLLFDFEKKMHIQKIKIGVGVSTGLISDNYKPFYIGAFGRIFF